LRNALKLSTITATLAVALAVLAAPTSAGHSPRHTGDGRPAPVKVHHHHPAAAPLTGRALWRHRIDVRFGYWGRHFGRHWGLAEYQLALRVVERESGWCPRASNGGTYRGLFQIWYAHAPGRDLYNPLSNIECAAQLWGRCGWSPWSQTAY
jgi:hypothetical protein